MTEWCEAACLRQWIVEELDTLDWANPRLVEHLRNHPAYQPRTMLTLLTYAYATAAFESEEIIRRSHTDEAFRSICGEHVPNRRLAISRFRRENRGLLKWSLMQLFKRVIKVRLEDFRLPAGLKRRLLDAAVARLDLARQMDHSGEEA